ncbi:MAG: deoxyribodipyrimidine photo-lyase [Ignavibacteria bacterium]|nr:deoxyribodipyrimidine photo-lyase [Ignavibacteria bacterium]
MIRQQRITHLPTNYDSIESVPRKSGAILYWMSRDQRVHDNWALLYAQEIALSLQVPLVVVFCLSSGFLSATLRQYGFMLRGLEEVERTLLNYNISFHLLHGAAEEVLVEFVQHHNISQVICDFDSLKIKRKWQKKVASLINVPLIEVDAHNIVPCRFVSQKVEFGAYTIRPKIKRLLPEFLKEFPKLEVQPTMWEYHQSTNWQVVWKSLEVDTSVKEIDWLIPGENAAKHRLEMFISQSLGTYHERRNNPNFDAQSNLSPYLHFGQIAAQRIALDVVASNVNQEAKDVFLEELIVRRELSDNFCFYNSDYDSFQGFPNWAKKSINEHRADSRDYVYSLEEFERASTHDALWNAAQTELTISGKMHGYMRMYWAKKILEWTKTPEEALVICIALNDKYELDGRDANGYTGIAWSIGGVHDRAWFDRPVYGKVRYMNANGCAAKFDVKEYVAKSSKS